MTVIRVRKIKNRRLRRVVIIASLPFCMLGALGISIWTGFLDAIEDQIILIGSAISMWRK